MFQWSDYDVYMAVVICVRQTIYSNVTVVNALYIRNFKVLIAFWQQQHHWLVHAALEASSSSESSGLIKWLKWLFLNVKPYHDVG